MSELRREIHIEASPETVYAFLTDPDKMRAWLAVAVEADARPAGMFRISDGGGTVIQGTFVELVACEKVVFTWGGVEGLAPGQSTVEFRLKSHDNGRSTVVTLRHFDLSDDSIESHDRIWRRSGLPGLRAAVEGRPPGQPCLAPRQA